MLSATSSCRLDGRPAEIAVSEPVVDRGSSFVGRAARISSPDDVQAILDEILTEKKVAKASHPTMYAWRCGSASSAEQQGKHDGGESGAGTVLSSLLESMAVRDVLVVCSRWYGGAPLGPARFRHIASTAKDALRRGGFVEEPADQKGKADKGRRKKGGK